MKDNQHEQLFTELTPAEAAVIEGGASFTERLGFGLSGNLKDTTRKFYVPQGGNITLNAKNVNEPSRTNKFFTASIRNVDSGNTNPKSVGVDDRNPTTWTGVNGGTYVIDFTDLQTGAFTGNATVTYG